MVELDELWGGGDQAPLGADGDSAWSVEAVAAAVVFDEPGLGALVAVGLYASLGGRRDWQSDREDLYVIWTPLSRSAAHKSITCSGTASNSRGLSCITYSFSM
jgi:hypothetical protein